MRLRVRLVGTRGELAEWIHPRPVVGLYLGLAVRIGSGPDLRPCLRLAQRIGSWSDLNPCRRVSASESCVAESAGPPGGQRAPELGQRLPGSLQGEASWKPRRRRGRRGKGWRRRQNCGEDDHDGNEAAMRPGHRGLSFSQGRPTSRPAWPGWRLQELKVRGGGGERVALWGT